MVGQAFVDLVEELKWIMPIQTICAHMDVARATYYRWRKNSESNSKKAERDQAIGEACATNKYRYGYRKIAALFAKTSEKTVQKVMQKYNWSFRVKVKKRKRTGNQQK